MINDLHTDIPTYKYVDDTTIYNISNNPQCNKVQQAMDTIMAWSESNSMKVNAKKTKEIFMCFNKHMEAPAVPSVACVTLLGLCITNTLSWDTHTDYLVKTANQMLYCLTMLRRAKVSAKDIVSIFCSKIRPVLEYASPVWHPGLTNEQSNALGHIQERALRLAYPT